MAYWIVKQTLSPLDLVEFDKVAKQVISKVQDQVGHLYETKCPKTGMLEKGKILSLGEDFRLSRVFS